ncbi:hypothetical protein [Burkholderia gladioli]|uniref:hypothetical protein n=1 Tax=Burkholderia gladioli TaxID=28095 RepID=UPI00163FEAC6|nr:hypothetical protein [Burkholderia gladioli]
MLLGLERDRCDQIVDFAVERVGRGELHLQGGLSVARRCASIPGEQLALDALVYALGRRLAALTGAKRQMPEIKPVSR